MLMSDYLYRKKVGMIWKSCVTILLLVVFVNFCNAQTTQKNNEIKEMINEADALSGIESFECTRKSKNIYEKLLIRTDISKEDRVALYLRIAEIEKKFPLEYKDKAFETYKKAILKFEKIGTINSVEKQIKLANMFYRIGSMYIEKDVDNTKHKEQGIYLLKSLTIYRNLKGRMEEEKRNKAIADTYKAAGNIYYKIGKYKIALNYEKKAADIYEQLLLNNLLSSLVGDMAWTIFQGKEENYEEIALAYAEKSLDISTKAGNKDYELRALRNLGNICHALKQEEKAKECYEKALNIVKIEEDRLELRNIYLSLSKFYNDLGEKEKAREYTRLFNKLYPEEINCE
ncbi:MAG: tetratricopeptide repeat protein [Thaumarchaeota archaeon]|nr:tetratricopeptide repeat protein [Nitrososphaerota archaeon]